MSNDIPERPRNVRAASKDLSKTDTVYSPSQQIVSHNKKAVSVLVGDRQLKVKFLSALDRMRLIKTLGGDLSKNELYHGYATLAYAVSEIDGEAVPPPVTVREIEFLVERLGDDGLNAVAKAYSENFADQIAGVDLDQAKN